MYKIYTRVLDNVIKVLWLCLLIKWLINDLDITVILK
jgi:hypothetical protein